VKSTLFILLYCLCPVVLAVAQPVQTVRGVVTDRDTKIPLIGVTVIVTGSDPLIGTSTNLDGEFTLTKVPAGRQTLQFSYVGYETLVLRELLIGSGRETVLDVGMKETIGSLDDVIVTPGLRKDIAMNTMAAASARLMSVEEASRYAGGFDDPARLASSFAGVAGNLANNAIVVRGNSPSGLLWRMEGIEIPTPVHFANLLSFGGGGITALSSHLLADSDFYTGAFPAEFGNALSGVFDIRMRNGNNRRREQTVKAGIMGLDASAEGPFNRPGAKSDSKSGSATYLFNYRYSTFSLLGPLLPDDADGITYQNLAFRLNLATGRTGSVSLWGIGATDWSGQSADQDPAAWVYDQDREDLESPTRFGAMGLQVRQNLSNAAFLSTSLAVSGNGLKFTMDRYTDGGILVPRERVRNAAGKAAVSSTLNYKFSPAHIHVSGVTAGRLFYNQEIRIAEMPGDQLETLIDETGEAWQLQGFTQSSYTIGRVNLLGGIHLHYFSLNGNLSAEPRAGLTIRTGSLSSLQLAYGRHTRIEHLPLYFAHPDNRGLGFTKADHLVAGFRQLLTNNLNLNVEVYYQHLTDVPVIQDSSFSVINLEQDWFIRDRLVNNGHGRNYGIDITLERYFSDGWYALLSGSVFESEYRGGDGIWRDTRNNRNTTLVLLGGREWGWVSAGKARSLGLNGRVNLMGGRKYSPVDVTATFMEREVVYDETRAFSSREPQVFYADLTIEYRINRMRTAGVWSLQFINLTGYKEFYGYRYNLRDEKIDRHREAIILPNFSYRFEF
jgi:hypothetical protein